MGCSPSGRKRVAHGARRGLLSFAPSELHLGTSLLCAPYWRMLRPFPAAGRRRSSPPEAKKEGAAGGGPWITAGRSGLEGVLERDLETARIARLVRADDLAKGRRGHAGLDVGVAAAGKQRVIKRVQRLEAELDVPLSVEAGVLDQRQVHVVGVGLGDLPEAPR